MDPAGAPLHSAPAGAPGTPDGRAGLLVKTAGGSSRRFACGRRLGPAPVRGRDGAAVAAASATAAAVAATASAAASAAPVTALSDSASQSRTGLGAQAVQPSTDWLRDTGVSVIVEKQSAGGGGMGWILVGPGQV